MNNQVCFVLEGNELYLDEVFVDFNDFPIYFSCISKDKYYLALCCNYENQDYVLVESSAKEIVDMLTAKITIRSTFTQKEKHWIVVAGVDVTKDEISLFNEPYLDEDILPKEGAKYSIVTENIKQYLRQIENKLYFSEAFAPIETIIKDVNPRNAQFELFETTSHSAFYVECFTAKTKVESLVSLGKAPFLLETGMNAGLAS